MSDKRDQPEDQPQRRRDGEISSPTRGERIRLLVLGLELLALLVGFLLSLLGGSIVPLFAVLVVSFLGYRQLDAWLDVKGC
jgi:hypothetical protein